LDTALQGKAVNISNLSEELGICDIVISCTGAPHIILDHQAVEHAMNVRSHRPLVLIDIAVPRDIAPEARQIRNIFLYDIDDLIHLSELNRRQREKEVHSATKIIEAEVERFDSWWQATEVKPIISRLTNKAEAIRKRQLELTLKRLPPFSPEELPRLEAMTKSIVQKILHDPIQCLKKNTTDNDDYISLVNELFHLDKE
jgi:glutamyl-tRNA reductase